jgi:hypothetical protein
MAVELLTMSAPQGIGITGMTGDSIRTVGSGTLDLAFVQDGRLVSRPMGGPGATVFTMLPSPSDMPAQAHVRRGRMCATGATPGSWAIPAVLDVSAPMAIPTSLEVGDTLAIPASVDAGARIYRPAADRYFAGLAHGSFLRRRL